MVKKLFRLEEKTNQDWLKNTTIIGNKYLGLVISMYLYMYLYMYLNLKNNGDKISLVQFCLNISFKFHHHNDPHYYFAKRVH